MADSPKLFPPTVEGIVLALKSTFESNKYAHKVVEQLLKKNKKWGSRDRAFVASSVYEIVRHWRKLWALLDEKPTTSKEKLYLLFGVWWLSEGYSLPDWKEFKALENFNLQHAKLNLPAEVAIQESFPDWFDKLAHEELGEAWAEIARALNETAPLAIRVNTLQISTEELLDVLRNENLDCERISGFKDAIEIKTRKNILSLPAFQNGLFEIQDAGSQLIAPFLKAKPNETVIDACAGAGGKTLHLANLMKNKGELIALDVVEAKLNELQRRTTKNKTEIVSAAVVDNEIIEELHEIADRLLIDAPCSGTGVIKRDVDTKWKLTPEYLALNIAKQQDILRQYQQMLKPGGTLVYATCSILPSENEKQTQWFLDCFGVRFKLLEELRLNPSAKNDGFYMARFTKLS